MSAKKSMTSANALLRRFEGSDPARIARRDQTRRDMALGMKIRRIREEAGLTQQALARKIGTQPSAISRIEDADYDGHSLNVLARVAQALDMRLIVDFAPRRSRGRGAKEM